MNSTILENLILDTINEGVGRGRDDNSINVLIYNNSKEQREKAFANLIKHFSTAMAGWMSAKNKTFENKENVAHAIEVWLKDGNMEDALDAGWKASQPKVWPSGDTNPNHFDDAWDGE